MQSVHPSLQAHPLLTSHRQEYERLGNFFAAERFPPGTSYQIDTFSQLQGLYSGYEVEAEQTVEIPRQQPATVDPPDSMSFCEAAVQLVQEPFFQHAKTILVLTDTHKLTSDRVLPHFQKIGPLLFDRTTIKGPFEEQWAVAFHQIEGHDPRIHCTWAAVFLLEALITAAPYKHYVLQDHDDTPLSLFEIQQLVNLVKTFHLPFFCDDSARVAMIRQNEEGSAANAGQVIFPSSLSGNLANQPVTDPLTLHQLLTEGRRKLMSTKLQAPQELVLASSSDTGIEVAQVAPTMQHLYDTSSGLTQNLGTPHLDPQRLGWEHHHEQKLKMLSGTPLYRSQAKAAADYLHAWALIGQVACTLGFDSMNNTAKQAKDDNVDPSLRQLQPPLTAWAGPFFEQAHLSALSALDSTTVFSATLPGPAFFMQRNLTLEVNETFHNKYEEKAKTQQVLFPAGLHAHGHYNKKCLSALDFFHQWLPWR